MNNNLCGICVNSRMCPTWGEVKCVAKKMRIYKPEEIASCVDYKKRPATGYKEPKCQCKDCLRNDSLAGEELEEK